MARRKGGLTLLELMIVLAIISILAATAISLFLRVQLRSKSVEARTNLMAIRTAEVSYFAETGTYVAAPQAPAAAPGAAKVPWPAAPLGFDTVSWAAEGAVYFVYTVTVAGTAYSIGAQGDLDGGGNTSDFGYIHPDPGGAFAPDPFGGGCATGVYNAANPAVPMANSVGGCNAADGQSDF